MILYPHIRQEIDRIKSVVAEAYGVEVPKMVEAGRDPDYVVPRMVAIVLCLHAGYSTTKVAMAFNRADHTNAIYARKRVRGWMAENPEFAQTVNTLAERCGLGSLEVAA